MVNKNINVIIDTFTVESEISNKAAISGAVKKSYSIT